MQFYLDSTFILLLLDSGLQEALQQCEKLLLDNFFEGVHQSPWQSRMEHSGYHKNLVQ